MMETTPRVAQSAIPVSVIRKLLHRNARPHVARIFAKAYPVEVARLLAALKGPERIKAFRILLETCDVQHVAGILSEMAPRDSLELIEQLEPKEIARQLSKMPADDATSLASRLPEPLASQVLTLMEAEQAADVRELLEHEERTAGRIMTRDYFALEEDVTIAEAVTALQKRSEEFEMVFYVYVVDRRDHLVGVISLKKLLTTPPSTQLKRVMEPKVISAKTDAEQEEVARLIAEYNLLAVPITDEEDRLVGIVTVDDAIDVIQGEVAEDLLALAGVTAEESVNTPTSRSLRLRAPWLLVNLLTTFAPAFVISRFDWALGMFPLLGAIVTMPMGMGGNGATQTLTVIIRGLALGEMTNVAQVTLKQTIVGLFNGLINGLVGALAVGLFFKNLWLGLVLATAMVLNLTVAALAGTLIPVALKRLKIDPAVASSVFVTTFTDVCGSLSFLGIATLMMRLLKAG
ncbi:MAG TPA: magnesium transporter [Blastocatellia bacterium]|nr:magnesium transporter [Blastocatellia bacterium]